MKMKKLLFGLFVSSAILGYSQDNAVKLNLNPIGLALANNIGLTYERKLTDAFSVSAKFNFSTSKAAPLSGTLNNLAEELLEEGSVNTDIFNNKFKSNGFGLALKYYPKKEALSGFYLMPYFSYQGGSIDQFDFDFRDSDGSLQRGLVDAGFNIIGGGLAIGKQWVIADKLAIDITWIGLGAGKFNLDVEGTEKVGNDVDFKFVEDEVVSFINGGDEEYSNYTNKIEHSSTDENILLSFKQGIPLGKMLSFSIGYTF